MPLSHLNVSHALLATDSMGYRLSIHERPYLMEPKKTKHKNILIVGGSFAASVFAIPGRSFSDYLEILLNKEHTDTQYHVYNLSTAGITQEAHFNQIISTGIYKNIDFVIWIDGYNELIMSKPSSFYFGFNLPFNIFPIRIFSEDLRDMPASYINPDDLCNGYLLYRKNIVNILGSLVNKS